MEILTVAEFFKQTGTFENISEATIDSVLAGAEKKLAKLKSQTYEEREAYLNEIITKVLCRHDHLSTFITMEISKMFPSEEDSRLSSEAQG